MAPRNLLTAPETTYWSGQECAPVLKSLYLWCTDWRGICWLHQKPPTGQDRNVPRCSDVVTGCLSSTLCRTKRQLWPRCDAIWLLTCRQDYLMNGIRNQKPLSMIYRLTRNLLAAPETTYWSGQECAPVLGCRHRLPVKSFCKLYNIGRSFCKVMFVGRNVNCSQDVLPSGYWQAKLPHEWHSKWKASIFDVLTRNLLTAPDTGQESAPVLWCRHRLPVKSFC
jgi:hypothetical protein